MIRRYSSLGVDSSVVSDREGAMSFAVSGACIYIIKLQRRVPANKEFKVSWTAAT